MKIIKTEKGKDLLVDDDDYDRLKVFRWYILKSNGTEYVYRRKYMGHYSRPRNLTIGMMEELGYPKSQRKHKDGNNLNFQKSNIIEKDGLKRIAKELADKRDYRMRDGILLSPSDRELVEFAKEYAFYNSI